MNDALIARGGTPVTLDRERIVFFDKTATFLLLEKYGQDYLTALYKAKQEETKDGKPQYTAELKSGEALEYFLWAGLQSDAMAVGEALTREQVETWIMPSTITRIFDAVLVAITRTIHTPPLPGKAQAATASPAAVAKKAGKRTASTSRKRNGSPSRNSAKSRKSSGRRR